MIKIALWIFLILSANVLMPSSIINIDLRDGREILNGLGIIMLLIVYLTRGVTLYEWPSRSPLLPLKPKLPTILAIFWGWAVVMSLARYNSQYSYVTLANISLYMILFWITMQALQEMADINKTLNVICIGALIQIVWCIMQKFGIDMSISLGSFKYAFMLKPEHAASYIGQPAGALGSVNGLSAYLAMAFPAFLRHTAIFKWRKLKWLKWWCLTPLVIWPFWHTHTKGGFIALIIGLVFMLAFMKINWKIKTAALLIIAGVFTFYMQNKAAGSWGGLMNNCRWETSKLAYHLAEHTKVVRDKIYITDTPNLKESLMGQGLGQFRVLFPPTSMAYLGVSSRPEHFAQLHNEPWQVKYEMGDIGFGMVYAFIIMLGVIFAIRLKKSQTALIISAAVLIIVINSHVNFLFHTPGLAPLAIIYLAMFVKLPRNSYKGGDIL